MPVERNPQNVETMSKSEKESSVSEMLPEYDFSSGVRGRYTSRLPAGSRIVVLDPDVAEFFEDSQAVNDALRTLKRPPTKQPRPKRRSEKESTGSSS